MLADMSASMWIKKAWLPYWPLYSQQVLHQWWIWGSHKWESMQGIHPGFETKGRRHEESKTGVIKSPTKRIYVLQIFLKTWEWLSIKAVNWQTRGYCMKSHRRLLLHRIFCRWIVTTCVWSTMGGYMLVWLIGSQNLVPVHLCCWTFRGYFGNRLMIILPSLCLWKNRTGHLSFTVIGFKFYRFCRFYRIMRGPECYSHWEVNPGTSDTSDF